MPRVFRKGKWCAPCVKAYCRERHECNGRGGKDLYSTWCLCVKISVCTTRVAAHVARGSNSNTGKHVLLQQGVGRREGKLRGTGEHDPRGSTMQTMRDIVHTAWGAASTHLHSLGATCGPGFGAVQVAQARTLRMGLHTLAPRAACRARTDTGPKPAAGAASLHSHARGTASSAAQTPTRSPRGQLRMHSHGPSQRMCLVHAHARVTLRVDADAARGTRKGNPSRGQTHPPEVGVTQTADTAQCAALRSCGIVHVAWMPDSDARVCVDWAERKVRTMLPGTTEPREELQEPQEKHSLVEMDLHMEEAGLTATSAQ
ncbi:hypothetical protein B0H10DRAFT_1969364 [Mycena sp. CBHHK59/15]|nr:hypothetical protein B0H10DRAFT_1969364 [Mycena sp. CBHHK59/15]